MEFFALKSGAMGFRKMHRLIADIVRAIPSAAEESSLTPAAEARIYPEPAKGALLDSFQGDWKAYVEPELHQLFHSARDTAIADLKRMKEENGLFELEIPTSHAEAWLSTLNQARLVLAADGGFSERELSSHELPDISDTRGMALFRINLYAFMQQCIIDEIE